MSYHIMKHVLNIKLWATTLWNMYWTLNCELICCVSFIVAQLHLLTTYSHSNLQVQLNLILHFQVASWLLSCSTVTFATHMIIIRSNTIWHEHLEKTYCELLWAFNGIWDMWYNDDRRYVDEGFMLFITLVCALMCRAKFEMLLWLAGSCWYNFSSGIDSGLCDVVTFAHENSHERIFTRLKISLLWSDFLDWNHLYWFMGKKFLVE